MNSTLPPHADDELLLRLVDDDLSATEGRQLESHLSICGNCRSQLDDITDILHEYQQFHDRVLKSNLPPPPKPWAPLPFAVMRSSWTARYVPRSFDRWRWVLAAAAILLAFLAVRRLEHPSSVKAAELLSRAAKAERSRPANHAHIRIRTRHYQWDRPARLPDAKTAAPRAASNHATETEIRQLLESAAYSWDDPLSAEAFSSWHDHLSDKRDQVATLDTQGVPETYVIHTTTAVSPISDASLTLRARDLHAVSCTLRFRAFDTIEITEVSDTHNSPGVVPELEPEHPSQPAVRPEPRTTPVKLAGPGDELLVIAALHRIGADLGEPIDVRLEGPDVVVNVAGVATGRRSEVQNSLSGIDMVRLETDELQRSQTTEVERPTRRTPPQVDTANSLLSELLASSPDSVSTSEIGDELIGNTENMIQRVYALRALARRFPPPDSTQLTDAQIAILHGMIRDHTAVIARSTLAISRRLAPILPRPPAIAPAADVSWQDLAQALLTDARTLDEALNANTTPDDPVRRKFRAAQALAEIDQGIARLRALVRP